MSAKRKYEYLGPLEISDSIRSYPEFVEGVPAVITAATVQHSLPSSFGQLCFFRRIYID